MTLGQVLSSLKPPGAGEAPGEKYTELKSRWDSAGCMSECTALRISWTVLLGDIQNVNGLNSKGSLCLLLVFALLGVRVGSAQ